MHVPAVCSEKNNHNRSVRDLTASYWHLCNKSTVKLHVIPDSLVSDSILLNEGVQTCIWCMRSFMLLSACMCAIAQAYVRDASASVFEHTRVRIRFSTLIT